MMHSLRSTKWARPEQTPLGIASLNLQTTISSPLYKPLFGNRDRMLNYGAKLEETLRDLRLSSL